MRLVVVVSVLLACGRVGFDATERSPVDGAVDASPGGEALVCVEDPCKIVVPQCGCEAGRACQRIGATTDQRGCVTEGNAGPDGLCGGDAECKAGHACLAQTQTTGRCHLYCAGDADCAPGLACARYDEGVGIGVCGSACTLEAGCPNGTACKVVLVFDFDSDGPVALPLCTAPSGGANGATCGSSLDCAAGLYCDDGGVCRPMCRQDGSLPCAAGMCRDALAPIKLGGVPHGFCR